MGDDSSDLSNAIKAIVRERINVLSSKRFVELRELPSQTSEEIVLQRTKLTLSVWHDVLTSQDHRIVVQAYKPGVLGIGRMHADGFIVNKRNEKRSLTVEEWAPFS
ncbi:MAG: hypothetical protein NTAFB01_07990 [Nitrospira sp.]